MFRKIVLLFCMFLLYSNAKDETQTVIFETSEGNITFALYQNVAPKACENFISLVKNGYYDGVSFHRVIKGFMIQGGDPTGTGGGGESIWKKPFEDEFSPYVLFEKKGLLAMANAGKNTNKSQFFITTIPTPWLNGYHTIFGEVIEGMDTVTKIENSAVDGNNKPLKPQLIIKAHIK